MIKRKLHLSFDDFILSFIDITMHTEYKSVFESPFFHRLYLSHNKFGTKFSLYCIFQTKNFSLNKCTGRFCLEFEQNSSWLKFGFHSIDNRKTYNDCDIVQDYWKVTSQLIRIVSKSAITSVLRIHGFSGRIDDFIMLNKKVIKINKLLCSDDNRILYGLTKSICKSICKEGQYYDNKIRIVFIHTNLRLEKTNALLYLVCNFFRNNLNVYFSHEWIFFPRNFREHVRLYKVIIHLNFLYIIYTKNSYVLL